MKNMSWRVTKRYNDASITLLSSTFDIDIFLLFFLRFLWIFICWFWFKRKCNPIGTCSFSHRWSLQNHRIDNFHHCRSRFYCETAKDSSPIIFYCCLETAKLITVFLSRIHDSDFKEIGSFEKRKRNRKIHPAGQLNANKRLLGSKDNNVETLSDALILAIAYFERLYKRKLLRFNNA